MRANFSIVQVKTGRKILLVLISIGLLWFHRGSVLEVLRFFRDPGFIVTYLQDLGPLGPILLFVLLFAQVFLALIPGHALVLASGYVYGAPLTIIVVATSTILGSQIAFWLARKHGRSLIHKLASPAAIDRWEKVAGNRGALFFFFSFVTPVFPADLMCYVAGLGKVAPKKFFLSNLCGRLLAVFAMTLIGAYKFHPPVGFWILIAVSLTVLSCCWWVYNRTQIHIPTRYEIAETFAKLISNSYRRAFGIRYDIQGCEHLPAGPKIFAPNHPGASDMVLLPPVLEEPVIALAEAGQFNNPLLGWILAGCGHIPVRKDRPQEAFEQALHKLYEGKNLLIFPEGTLNPNCQEMKGRTGAVRLSLKTGVAIIPIGVYVNRADSINLRWIFRGRGHGGRFLLRGSYTVRIGEPWLPTAPAENVEATPVVHELTQNLMDQIRSLVLQAGSDHPNPRKSLLSLPALFDTEPSERLPQPERDPIPGC